MSLRRDALPLIVALVAAIGGSGLIGVAAAQASSTSSCVGLVLDGRSLGSDVSTGCVAASKAGTGVDVLDAAGHSIGYRNDGLICTIDGLPKGGCATVDDDHYWAYFHRAPGKTSWVYSNEGAGTYSPVAGSTEGWVYDDGTSLKPENVPYSQLCNCKPATSSPTPTPTHPKSTKPTHHHSATPKPSVSHHPSSSTSPTPTSTKSTPDTKHPSRHRSKHPAKKHQTTPPTATPTPRATPDPATTPSSAILTGGSTSGSSGSSPIGLIIGAVAVVLLGGAATYLARRRTRT